MRTRAGTEYGGEETTGNAEAVVKEKTGGMNQGTDTRSEEARDDGSPRKGMDETNRPEKEEKESSEAARKETRSEGRPTRVVGEDRLTGSYQRSMSWHEEASAQRWKYTLLPKIEVPERFSGETRKGPTIKNYVMQLDNLRARWERDRLDPEEFFRGLANTLTGEAETFYRLSRRELLEWTASAAPGERDPTTRFLRMLEEQFPAQTPERVTEFREFRRRTGESLLAYYGRLVELAEDMGCCDTNRLISKFLNGLHYELRRDVAVRVFEMGAEASLKEVYEVVKRVEIGRRMCEIETSTEKGGERRRPAWAATPAERERPPRKAGEERRCHNCGQLGHLRRDCRNPPACSTCGSEEHLRRDCPEAPVCERCGRKGHQGKDCYANKREGRVKKDPEEVKAQIARLQRQLEELEGSDQKGSAMLAKSEEEEEEGSEASFALMARPVRERGDLGLRARHRYFPHESPVRERGPRRDTTEARRGVKVKQAILDTGAHNVLIGAPLARLLGLDREDRLIAEGYLIMTAEGGTAKWVPKTRSTVEIVIRAGHPDECIVRMHCGVSTSEDYDLLLGVEYMFTIGTTICMWEERLKYRITYWEHDSELAELPVRFIRREPREAYQAMERPLEEELSIMSWKEMGQTEAARKQYEEIWGVSDNLREPVLDLRAFQKPLVVLELYGGIATGLAAVLKAGHTVAKYLYVDNDGGANLMAWHHLKLLKARYHAQLMEEAAERGAEWLCSGVEEIDDRLLAKWGRIDLVIAGWSCQGLSRAGRGRGIGDVRSTQFRDLARVLKMIKRRQGEVAYIIENVDMEEDARPAIRAARDEITEELGAGVAWDAAQNGSRAHRPRRYWQNVIPEAALRYQLSRMERPRARNVEDILEPGRLAAPVTEADHPSQYPCNEVGEPRQAWPTLVSYENARGFREVGGRAGPGMVYDQARGVWEEPTAQERELAMGFLAGATACEQVTEQERKVALGRAMDLNALQWLFMTMANHLERKWLERRIGKATTLRPQTLLAANKEMEARTMLGGLEKKEESQWWRGISEDHRRASWRDDREAIPGRYADPLESEEEWEEEEEIMTEESGEGRGDTPEEFHDSDFDMSEEYDGYEELSSWPPTGPAFMALEVPTGENSERAREDEGMNGQGEVETAGQGAEQHEQARENKGEDGQGEGETAGQGAEQHEQARENKGANGQEEAEIAGQGGEQHAWDIGEGLQGAHRQAVEALLVSHRQTFAYTLKELGCCNCAVMTLELTTTVPVYQRRRRMSPQDLEICKEKCLELLEAGLIRRSESRYAAATVVAARMDLTGAVLARRMCGDYRDLNKVTVAERYSTPMVDELFDQLSGAPVFSTLDMMQGFNQIPIAEADKEKTAFHGPDGAYEWNRMPFGLKNASLLFQKVMDAVLRGMEGALCYIDDVIVFSATPEEHVERLAEALRRIKAAGLTCDPKKCRFGHTAVKYLGFKVAGGRLAIQEAKVAILDQVSQPRDKSALRALLGFLNYYRKFVENFSRRAAPLNRLLKDDVKWQWGEQQEAALKDLMGAVKNGAVLQLPKADLPFVLYTDWSSTGMGAVLSQQEGGEEKVVAFASRSCNPAEANYSSYEGEGLAAVWAVGHFRVYLQGRPFTLVTDHQPLLWLMQNQSLTGRNARWAMKLQEYQFTIRHRPGKTMQHVDGLSRNPPRSTPRNPPAVAPEMALAALVTDPVTPLRREQQAGATDVWEDRETLAWLKGETAEGSTVSARARSRGQHYRWYQDQVQIRTQDGWKRVPEPKEREGVIREVHNRLGHFGPLRTQQLLQTGWWWAGMRKEVKDWVAKCPACIRNRAAFERSKAELQPLPIVGLGYRWPLDLAGELPLTKRGRRYVVVMIEHVSKWVEVRAVSHKTAEAVTEAFEEQVLTRFGACGEVLTYQGTEFQGEFEELLSSCLIPHRTTSRYHPQSDGLTERIIQTLKRGLRAYGETRKRDWDRQLHWIMAGYRFSKQAALRDLSPYHLLFGREAVLPVGAPGVLTDVVTAGTAEKWAALAAVRGEYLRRLLPAALESLHVAQLRDIHRYRQRQEQRAGGASAALQEGQEVYIRRPKKDGLDVGLSQQQWTVKEVRDSGVLVLESEAGVRAVDHITNVARAGGYQGPVTRARAAKGHGRGQEVITGQKQ